MKNICTSLTILLLYLNAPAQTWTQMADIGAGPVAEARAFSIGNFGYVGGPTAALWRYDTMNDTWAQMAAMPGPVRSSPAAFSIGNKGYLGTGGGLNDFYEYDPSTNTWAIKANFGGAGREGAVGISISGKGYIGTGGNYLADWWEYDTTGNTWTQKASLAGPGRYHAGAFSINGIGYICTGFNGSFFNDLYAYDPVANSWIPKASLPGSTRDRPVGMATLTRGYIITGWDGSTALNDAYEYNPITDSWTILTSMPTAGRYNACGLAVNNNIYIGTGQVGATGSDWWRLEGSCIAAAQGDTTSCTGICNGTASVSFPTGTAGLTFLWSGGETTAVVQNLCAGTYTVTVTDSTGCVSVATATVTDAAPIQLTPQITQPLCFGDSTGGICVSFIGDTLTTTLLWSNGVTGACISNVPGGTYTVTVTDSTGCSNSSNILLIQPAQMVLNILGTDATCNSCPNGSAVAQLSGGTGPMSYSWSTGTSLAFVNNLLPGIYTCCATDNLGCIACDTVEILFPSGIADLNGAMITVSPNPFNDQLVIETVNLIAAGIEIKMYDLSGRIIKLPYKSEADKIYLSTEQLDAGIYFVEIAGNKFSKMVKVVKE